MDNWRCFFSRPCSFMFLPGEHLQSPLDDEGSPDSSAIRAAQPQEAFLKRVEFLGEFLLFQNASCAFGTPIARNRGYPDTNRVTLQFS
jgi:hypothetical protein